MITRRVLWWWNSISKMPFKMVRGMRRYSWSSPKVLSIHVVHISYFLYVVRLEKAASWFLESLSTTIASHGLKPLITALMYSSGKWRKLYMGGGLFGLFIDHGEERILLEWIYEKNTSPVYTEGPRSFILIWWDANRSWRSAGDYDLQSSRWDTKISLGSTFWQNSRRYLQR